MADRTLGVIIKEARLRAALSQSALARAANVAANHISRIEAGERNEIGFFSIARIALALGLSLDEIAVNCGVWPGKGARLEPVLASTTIVLEELRRASSALNTARSRMDDVEMLITGTARLAAQGQPKKPAKKAQPKTRSRR